MSKHTPGPWVTVNYGGNAGDGEFEGLGVCQQGKSMAVMMGDPNKFVCDCPSSKYQEANARLIAAAPELLEVLEKIEWIEVGNLVRHCPSCFAMEPDGHKQDCTLRAAIAKAKGEA